MPGTFTLFRTSAPSPEIIVVGIFCPWLLRIGTETEYCDEHVCVSLCVSVCLSAHEYTRLIFQIPYALIQVIYGRGLILSGGVAIC